MAKKGVILDPSKHPFCRGYTHMGPKGGEKWVQKMDQ